MIGLTAHNEPAHDCCVDARSWVIFVYLMIWLKRLFGIGGQTAAAPAKPLSAEEKEHALEQIDEYVRRDVYGGFRTDEEIVESTVEVLTDDFEPAAIRPLVVQRTRHHLAQYAADAAAWPEVTDCDRLDRAFAELEARGIVCRQDFSCCGNCGSAEIGEEMAEVEKHGIKVRGYAFYHMQDTERATEGGGLYLNYGATEDGEAAAIQIANELCDALRAGGLTVDWDGSSRRRIGVKLDWKKRRTPRCAGRSRH